MKGVTKFILYIILIIVLAVAGVLLYQTYGVPDKTDWEDKDEVELEQEHTADSVAASSGIFD